MQHNKAHAKPALTWQSLGDVESGRPNLGQATSVQSYRLLFLGLRETLVEEFSEEKAEKIFRMAGYKAGTVLASRYLGSCATVGDGLKVLPGILEVLGIGLMRIEHWDPLHGDLIFTISEDQTGSGTRSASRHACPWDEGFYSGLFSDIHGQKLEIAETDCWSLGKRICRFRMSMAFVSHEA